MKRLFVLLIGSLVAPIACFSQSDTLVDISLQHDATNSQLKVYLRSSMFFDGILSNLVFTVKWPQASSASLGLPSSPWCPLPSTAFPIGPTSAVAPGNGFKYRTYYSVALAPLGAIEDEGGCGQSLPAETWVEVCRLPITNNDGSVVFEIAQDDFVVADNRDFYVSLLGQVHTGGIFDLATAVDRVATQLLGIDPNPTEGLVRLTWANDEPIRVEVVDVAGSLLMTARGQGPTMKLDLSALPAGAYALRISSRTGTEAQRLVVRH